jgi:dCMP deaminase
MRNNVKLHVRQQKKERAMNYNTWDEYFINLLPGISSKSKLPIKVGALAAGPDHDIRLSGFNGLPNGVADLPERLAFPEAYKWGEHAERNLIYFAAKNGIALSGCTIYTQSPPCLECTKAIIAAGFVECVVDGAGEYARRKRYEERGGEALAKYKEESKLAAQMFKEKGTIYKTYYPDYDRDYPPLKDRSAA